MKALTAYQKRFCDILVLMERSGKVEKRKAYEMVYQARGKTAEVEASRTLKLPQVKAYISRARARDKQSNEKTEAEIIAQFEKLGFSVITDFATWDSKHVKLKPSKEIPKDKIAALKVTKIPRQRLRLCLPGGRLRRCLTTEKPEWKLRLNS